MSDSIRRYRESGMAMLETVAMLILLSMFGLSAVALVDYINEIQIVRELVDAVAVGDPVKPFLLANDSEGNISLSLNERGLSEFLDTRTKALAEGIREIFSSASEQSFRVEMGYVVLKIDSETGVILGSRRSREGSKQLGDFGGVSQTCSDLEQLFSDAASKNDAAGRSAFAIPTAIHPGGSAAYSFLPETAVVGVRVLKDLRGSFFGRLISELGGSAVASSCKLEVLRGEVG